MVQDVKYKTDLFLQKLQKAGVSMPMVRQEIGLQGFQGTFVGRTGQNCTYYKVVCMRSPETVYCQLTALPNNVLFETRNIKDLEKISKKILMLKGC